MHDFLLWGLFSPFLASQQGALQPNFKAWSEELFRIIATSKVASLNHIDLGCKGRESIVFVEDYKARRSPWGLAQMVG